MQKYRVALIGLRSLFGQASSLLLKLNPGIYNLRLYDETDINTADEIRVINTPCKVEAYQGKAKLNKAIKGSDIIVIGDDILSTPLTCFDAMAPKMPDYAKAIAESSPNAVIIVAASPINKLVPVLTELLKENGYYDCNKIMGPTTTHSMRANCVLASYVNTDPKKVFLPVVGGDSESTIVPLFSQAKPHFNISEAIMKRLIEEIKQGPSLIFETKGTSEALNKAYCTNKFLNSVIAGLRGEPNIMNIAFTKTTQVEGTEYFALPVLLGRFGIQTRYGIPRILPFENDLIRESVFSIKRDTDFAKLFCKSRETAVETCSRNVIRHRKSQEFEDFVNGLKINKKECKVGDKIVDKIKPPIPIESEQLSEDKSFDIKAFCIRHQVDNSKKHRIIPPYMRTNESITPLSLGYTFGKDKRIVPYVINPSAETLVCEPVICPDKPKDEKITYNNIVSLVESLVKKTTEKMLSEKKKDKNFKETLKKVENVQRRSEEERLLKGSSKKDENLKESSGNVNHLKQSLEKYQNLQESYEESRSLENSKNIRNLMFNSEKVPNFSQNAKKQEKKFSDNHCVVKSKGSAITNGLSKRHLGKKTAIPIRNVNKNENIDEKTNQQKKKYANKVLESIFKPTVSTFKKKFEYDSCILKRNQSKGLRKTETTQQNTIMNTKTNATQLDGSNIVPKVFNFKSNRQSSQYQNKIVPMINIPTSKENKNCRNSEINKNLLSTIEYEKEQRKHKKSQNISDPKNDLSEQMIFNSAIISGKHILSDDSKKTPNNSGDIDKVTPQLVQNDDINMEKTHNLEGRKNENLAHDISKVENNKYFEDRYKNVFQKLHTIPKEKFNENDKIKQIKDMKNVLLENLNISEKKGNSHYTKINRKPHEYSIVKEIEKNTYKTIQNPKYLLNKKSHKNTKDYVNNTLRSKCQTKSLAANDRMSKGEKYSVNHITGTENIKANPENKFSEKIKSVCYNAFANEVTEINDIAHKYDLEASSTPQKQHTTVHGQNNNIKKPTRVESAKEIKSIPETKTDKKQIDETFQDNHRTQDKTFSVLMKILDNDVFENGDQINNNNITDNEVNKLKTLGNDSRSPEEQMSIENDTSSIQEQVAEEGNKKIKSKINEEVFPENNLQSKHQTENPEATEMIFEAIINEIKLVSEPKNKSIDTSEPNVDEQSILNVKETTQINNLTNIKTNEGSDSFSQSKEAISPNNTAILNNKKSQEFNAEEEGPNKNQMGLVNLRKSKINNVLLSWQNISKSSDKSRQKYNEHHNQGKPRTDTSVSVSADNPANTNKVGGKVFSKIAGRSLPNITREIRNNKKTAIKHNPLDKNSITYIRSLSSLKDEKNNRQKKIINLKNCKTTIKNLNDFDNQIKSGKENTCKKKNKNSNMTTAPLKNSKIRDSKQSPIRSIKKEKKSNMKNIFTGHFEQKVNEINKAEHSFSLKDKNGINNYFLLKGLLPKIRNSKNNPGKQKNSLLKTNVCNEDPFMSIKDKLKTKLKTINEKSVRINKKKYVYTTNEGSNDSDSLQITHNSLCSSFPVHGNKHYFNDKEDQNRSIFQQNKSNKSKINVVMLNDLCRMSNKVKNSQKNSSQQLSQKTHNYKLYSTSAMPMRKSEKSETCLRTELRNNMKQALKPRNEGVVAKLPKGYIKKQRITKILEKESKNNNTKKNNLIKAEKPTKTVKDFDLKERNKTEIGNHLHPCIIGKATKIDETFFHQGVDSSYIKRYLKCPPKCIPHYESLYSKLSNNNNSSKSTSVDASINWSSLQNNPQQTERNPVSVENDILVRGTCSDHVKHKGVWNKATTSALSDKTYCDEQKIEVNSIKPSQSNAYSQYTKDFVKCEYPTDQKLPSIRHLHKRAFCSN